MSWPGTTTAPPRGSDDPRLREALREANLPALLGVLRQLTGDDRWLHEPYAPAPQRGPGDHDDAGLPDGIQDEVRAAAYELVLGLRDGSVQAAPPPSPDAIVEALTVTLGTRVDPDAGPLLAEELGLVDREVAVPTPAADFDVVIIGAGFSGIVQALRLKQAGIPFVVVDKDAGPGGTWIENRYPGCGVDTPIHLYSFAFKQRPDWPRFFAKQPEVRAYLDEVVAEHDLGDHIRFGEEVQRADWDADAHRWTVRLRGGDTLRPRILVSAVGAMNIPKVPQIPGLDTFAGPCMHSARWDPDTVTAGQRVGVIGTGASAMQLVPTVQREAERVTVFQRTPQWAIPNPNAFRELTPNQQLLMAEVPFYQGWYRLRHVWNFGDRLHGALQIDPAWEHPERSINKKNDSHRRFLTAHIESELAGRPDLIDKCVPTYPPYGKRPLMDHGWFRTLAQDNVELVTEDIVEVTPAGVRTRDGVEHELDVLAVCTGFQILDVLTPMDVRGRDGVRLRGDTWAPQDARAHLGMTVPGHPNLFLLFGPNTSAGHGGSHVLSVEMQVRYIMQLLGHMIATEQTAVEVRREPFEAYNAEIDELLSHTIWTHPGMTTYYRNAQGRIVTNTPWTNARWWHETIVPALDDYAFSAR